MLRMSRYEETQQMAGFLPTVGHNVKALAELRCILLLFVCLFFCRSVPQKRSPSISHREPVAADGQLAGIHPGLRSHRGRLGE